MSKPPTSQRGTHKPGISPKPTQIYIPPHIQRSTAAKKSLVLDGAAFRHFFSHPYLVGISAAILAILSLSLALSGATNLATSFALLALASCLWGGAIFFYDPPPSAKEKATWGIIGLIVVASCFELEFSKNTANHKDIGAKLLFTDKGFSKDKDVPYANFGIENIGTAPAIGRINRTGLAGTPEPLSPEQEDFIMQGTLDKLHAVRVNRNSTDAIDPGSKGLFFSAGIDEPLFHELFKQSYEKNYIIYVVVASKYYDPLSDSVIISEACSYYFHDDPMGRRCKGHNRIYKSDDS